MALGTPEKLMQAALSDDLLPSLSQEADIGPIREVEFGPLCAAAIREGLGGIFYRRLKHYDDRGLISHGLMQLLKRIYYAGVQKNIRLLRALSEILEQVNDADIKVVLLQGISLVDNVYPDIGSRALTDVDLWVMPGDFDDFADCLQRLGYRLRKGYPQVFIRGQTIVDVRTHLFWAERIKARDSLLRLDQKVIFKAAERFSIEGRTAYRLDRADQFIYLALHLLKHNALRLIWLVDIVHLVRSWEDSDWTRLHKRAEDLGQYRTVQYLVFLLEDLAGLHLPEICRKLFAAPPLKTWEKAVLGMRRKKDQLPVWASLVLMPADLDPVRKIRFIFENIFPDPPVLRQVFSRRAHLKNWQLYGLRLLQLLGIIKAD